MLPVAQLALAYMRHSELPDKGPANCVSECIAEVIRNEVPDTPTPADTAGFTPLLAPGAVQQLLLAYLAAVCQALHHNTGGKSKVTVLAPSSHGALQRSTLGNWQCQNITRACLRRWE